MKDLFIAKPGKVGRWAAEWWLFKQQVLYPSWYLVPGLHLPESCCRHEAHIPSGRILRCALCTNEGILYYDVTQYKWVLEGLDPGHIIGRDREPKLRCEISNIQPECRACNEAKER